jgi:hypothetical protein
MVARTNYEVNLILDNVALTTVRPDLVAALVETAATPKHGEVLIGRFVIVGVAPAVVLDCGFGTRPVEGSPHSASAVGFVDLPVARSASGGFDVACVLAARLKSYCTGCEHEDGCASH